MGSSYNDMEYLINNINNSTNNKKNGIKIDIDRDLGTKCVKIGNGFSHKSTDQTPQQGRQGWLAFGSKASIVKSALPCVAFLVLYGLNDTIRFLPGISDINCVNFHNISALEYRLFVGHPPHLFFSAHHSPLLDLLSALPYLFHYTIPILFPVFLSLSGMGEKITRFYRLLSLAMWSHYFIWFLLPTAPPWLADKLDDIRSLHATSPMYPGTFEAGSLQKLQREGCAFARLDAETGWNFFKQIFDGNPVPFASFPSGHVAWPVCMALTTSWSRRGSALFFIYILWVSWSTMYSCHHYFSDIVAAVVVVVVVDCIYHSRHYRSNRYYQHH